MDLGSIADVLEGEAGGLIKNILGMALFTPFIASVDFGWFPGLQCWCWERDAGELDASGADAVSRFAERPGVPARRDEDRPAGRVPGVR